MTDTHSQEFKFGEFVLDLNRGALQRDGLDINLRPQSYEVLAFLATQTGKLVSKEELLKTVWNDVPVTDDSLTQCIVEIRKAIEDHSRAIIRTVPKRGFIFDPPDVTATTSPGEEQPGAEPLHGKRRNSWLALAAVVVIVVFAALQLNKSDETNSIVDDLRTAAPPNSIAVLPFVDMSEGQDQQYFGDGIAEEILTKLTEFPELVVVARTSSFLFRGRQLDAAEIGRSLNTAHVLEGSIRKSGNQLRITAQLIETSGGTHVWSKPFDRELTVENLLEIQSEVAASVADTIASGASPTLRPHDSGRKAANPEAYDLYLEGMFYLHRIRTAVRASYEPEEYEAAIERFEAAIDYDPDWAQPRAALGRTMHFRAEILRANEDDEAFEWYRLAKQHLLDAIRLDPEYALAYSALGHVILRLDFDFPAAEAAFNRAHELGGNFPWRYALFLRAVGRFDEAIEQYHLAIERDPLSAGPRHQLATTYRCVGRYVDSITELEKVLRLAPSRDDLYIPLSYLYLKTGDIDKGRELFDRYGDSETVSISHGQIYVLLGMLDKAHEALDQTEAAERWSLEYFIATALILGEEERAMRYLEAAAADDPRRVAYVNCIDGIDALAGNARFQQVLKTTGMPEKPL